jgi:hypothetical protein
MSNRITSRFGILDKLEVHDLRIFRDGTPLKWSSRLKNKSIKLLNKGATAKLTLFQSGTKAILGHEQYVIGSSTEAWSFSVLTGGIIQVGLAKPTRDLSSIEGDIDRVFTQLDVSAHGTIVFVLDATKCTVEYNGVIISTLDVTLFTGETMHAWLSGVNTNSGFSITINQYRFIDINVLPAEVANISTLIASELSIPIAINTGTEPLVIGNASFETTGLTTVPGQNFTIASSVTGTGLSVIDDDGNVLIDSSLKVNLIEHTGTGPLVLKGGVSAINVAQLNAGGDLTVTPGSILTQCAKAPAGSTIKLVNSSNVGMHISASGNVSFDFDPKLNSIQSNTGSNLAITESTNGLGLTVVDTTGVVISDSLFNVTTIDSSGVLSIGSISQTTMNMGRSGTTVEVKGGVEATNGIDVTGNIVVTGTIDGIDLLTAVNGTVTAHSDVTSVGSGAIISGAERTQIGTNTTNNTGVITVHSDITSAGSGAIITGVERTAIGTNTSNNTGVVTVHSDVTDAGSGAIITGVERTAIGTNDTNATGSVNIHSDITITTPANLDIFSYNSGSGEWENKTTTTAGIPAAVHTHVASNITDFNTGVNDRLTVQKGNASGIASLNSSGKVISTQLALTNLRYVGVWDADTNAPALTSSVGVQGGIYVVSVAGSTALNGVTDWKINDWCVFDGSAWVKLDNTDAVTSVAGKTGAVTLAATDITDITNAGSGAIITGAERTAIGANNTNNTGVVTVHSDVTSAGSGAIISAAERTAIGTNTTNNTGSVTVHSDITDAGSGIIISVAERAAIVGGSPGTVTDHSDITDAGSGIIISGAERTAIGTNTTNNTGVVTVHSDVTDAGSGAIITGVERTAIGTNTTNNTGSVTVHSDVTGAGSGAIITGVERTAIGTNTSNLALKLALAGGTMSNDIDLSNNNLDNVTNQTIKGTVTLGVTEVTAVSVTPNIIGVKTTLLGTATTQWIAPAGTEVIIVKLWGGGGGGGRRVSFNSTLGGTGGYTEIQFPATVGDEFWITPGRLGYRGGSGGDNGGHGQGGSGGISTSFEGGGGGSYSSIHKFDGVNYTLVACAGGGGGGGAGSSPVEPGGGGNGGDGGSGTGNNIGGTGGSDGIGGTGVTGNGEDYGALTQATLAAFGGAGATVVPTSDVGGAGGGGYGGGGGGRWRGGGGGGGGYVDLSGTNTLLTVGTSNGTVPNSADPDYIAPYGGSTTGGNGKHGMCVIGGYYLTNEWHKRIIKTASGNDVVIENSADSTKLAVRHAEGVDVDGVLSVTDITESSDSITGSIVSAGGVTIKKNITVGGVIRLDNTSAPSAPSADSGYFYVRNSLLYFMGDDGTEKTVSFV